VIEKLTVEAYKALTKKNKKNKYGAKQIKENGITFDSKLEHKRYRELLLLQYGGEIEGLRVHTRWPLMAHQESAELSEILVGYYESDFDYFDNKAGGLIAEDCKGLQTPLSAWKFKHAKIQYPDVTWRIVKA
jgi:hypothetical protein